MYIHETVMYIHSENGLKGFLLPFLVPLLVVTHNKVTSLDKKRTEQSDVSNKVKSELDSLGIKLNTTLTKTIKSTSVEFVLSAIQTLKEAMASGNIERPGGWLNAAIKDGWKPNEKYIKQDE